MQRFDFYSSTSQTWGARIGLSFPKQGYFSTGLMDSLQFFFCVQSFQAGLYHIFI